MKLRMGEITGGEARALYARRPVVLLPLGSHEDQGPHAPMGDYLLAELVAERIARAATEAGVETVVAPVLPFGKADFFGPMPGGIALSARTFALVLEEMIEALLRHGLDRIVVLNGHGGNAPVIHDVTQGFMRAGRGVIPCFYLWKVAGALLPDVVGAERARRSAGHGADPLGSIALHLTPERMRMDLVPAERAPPGTCLGLPFIGWGAVSFDGAEINVPAEYDGPSPEGLQSGDPRLCSAETGRELVERLVSIGAGFVRHLAERPAGKT
ncbi:creatininase family protein [Muricoccus pecuniae]|uniref:Creatinine amidohydrolase n=1 Tax=Muricoccus pecuniae TaxID=693023 RepID=A0A840YG22_9PROT|nr:creatininase family protein [Roseomonas pecuniae]MBB5695191.1 creatinine amidohydrolase [Roseomonas pecuniae]